MCDDVQMVFHSIDSTEIAGLVFQNAGDVAEEVITVICRQRLPVVFCPENNMVENLGVGAYLIEPLRGFPCYALTFSALRAKLFMFTPPECLLVPLDSHHFICGYSPLTPQGLNHPRSSINANSVVVVFQLRMVMLWYTGSDTIFDRWLRDALAMRREK